MKSLKHFLLIGAMCTFLSNVHAQTVPPIKQRTNSGYQQVDDYLIAPKRLGIPTGTSDNLDATISPANTIKLQYRTDINTLRAYNPVTGLWSNAVPGIDESTLLHKTGDEAKNGALTVNTLFAPHVSVNSSEPVGNFYVRGTTYLDASRTGGVIFYGVGGENNQGGIFTGQALPSASPGDNTEIVVKDFNNNGLLKTIPKEDLPFIQVSPAIPQIGSIRLRDGKFTNINAFRLDTYTNTYTDNPDQSFGSSAPYLVNDYSALNTSTNESGFRDRYATAQVAMIEEFKHDCCLIGYKSFAFQNSVDYVNGVPDDTKWVNQFKFYADGKFVLAADPRPASANYEILLRDTVTGEVKKISLADLKTALNNIQ